MEAVGQPVAVALDAAAQVAAPLLPVVGSRRGGEAVAVAGGVGDGEGRLGGLGADGGAGRVGRGGQAAGGGVQLGERPGHVLRAVTVIRSLPAPLVSCTCQLNPRANGGFGSPGGLGGTPVFAFNSSPS